MAMQLFQKSYSKDTWPAISFTGDESSALHLVTNAVNVYDPADFASGELVAPSVECLFLASRSTGMHLRSSRAGDESGVFHLVTIAVHVYTPANVASSTLSCLSGYLHCVCAVSRK